MKMNRMAPAMILAGIAGMAGGFNGVSNAPGMQALTPNVNNPGDIPSNGNKADRLLRAIMGGGRSWRRAGNKFNGRPDTGTRRAQRAARKRRNQLINKRAQ